VGNGNVHNEAQYDASHITLLIRATKKLSLFFVARPMGGIPALQNFERKWLYYI